ncbi:MAG: rhodanese-like domain-containing protein [Deltaproteobacteria bacterium]|nr:rhodanese-like domain-containing protein [Deltaproteobacteria bacterium]
MASTLNTLQRPGLTDQISREELYRRFGDASLTVVDVLPKEAYNGGHIPGAINLPLAELAARAQEVLPNRTIEIAVYCASFT